MQLPIPCQVLKLPTLYRIFGFLRLFYYLLAKLLLFFHSCKVLFGPC